MRVNKGLLQPAAEAYVLNWLLKSIPYRCCTVGLLPAFLVREGAQLLRRLRVYLYS